MAVQPKEFKIIIEKDGRTTIKLSGYETSSKDIAKDFEEAIGDTSNVNWAPKAHLGQGVKVGH